MASLVPKILFLSGWYPQQLSLRIARAKEACLQL